MSGAQIGGVVGGVAGAIVGSVIPGLGTALGAQVGYALGSAIGGYVDPTRIQGPRLSDSAAQTSNVGIPLTFGYGIFPTAGNIIWADELKEHVKRQRQGKGGGAKTTTYTYTRSYAIGICEGPIYGYVQIKRNGKLVYTSDPNAPVGDKDYSAKWLQKVTLYYGDEEQMPDSTIEAVVGAGNVSPFRGLAYIVIENDDLTELAGAIPQYEFVVNATQPDVFITSRPYPLLDTESLFVAAAPITGFVKTVLHIVDVKDYIAVSSIPITGEIRDQYVRRKSVDYISAAAYPLYGESREPGQSYKYTDIIQSAAVPINGMIKNAIISTKDSDSKIYANASPIAGVIQ